MKVLERLQQHLSKSLLNTCVPNHKYLYEQIKQLVPFADINVVASDDKSTDDVMIDLGGIVCKFKFVWVNSVFLERYERLKEIIMVGTDIIKD